MLQPEVKELLSTCAEYNLEHLKRNGEVDSRSVQVLEEIRRAEAIENNVHRNKNSVSLACM